MIYYCCLLATTHTLACMSDLQLQILLLKHQNILNDQELIKLLTYIQQTKYKPAYEREFKFVTLSKLGDNHTYCEICRTYISISHGGRHDVGRHKASKKHNVAYQL